MLATLFGKYVEGRFVPYEDAKIWIYKENAENILLLSPNQLGAETDVISAIHNLTQDEENGNFHFFSVY